MTTVAKYREAARMIADGRAGPCCYALFAVGQDDEEFCFMFKPTENECLLYNCHSFCWFGPTLNKENQLARSLALLFMAEMEERK
jgi:hypothetical protein